MYDANQNQAVGFNNAGLDVTYVIPEPASLALLGLGLAALFSRRRRRQ
jgi:hypothetical protein